MPALVPETVDCIEFLVKASKYCVIFTVIVQKIKLDTRDEYNCCQIFSEYVIIQKILYNNTYIETRFGPTSFLF